MKTLGDKLNSTPLRSAMVKNPEILKNQRPGKNPEFLATQVIAASRRSSYPACAYSLRVLPSSAMISCPIILGPS
jgi:hypothetical protein